MTSGHFNISQKQQKISKRMHSILNQGQKKMTAVKNKHEARYRLVSNLAIIMPERLFEI